VSDAFAELEGMRARLGEIEDSLRVFGRSHRERDILVEESLEALRRFRDTLWTLDKAFET
jgi:hypothetical protein